MKKGLKRMTAFLLCGVLLFSMTGYAQDTEDRAASLSQRTLGDVNRRETEESVETRTFFVSFLYDEGAVSIESPEQVEEGETLAFSVRAEEGYEVDAVSVNGETISPDGKEGAETLPFGGAGTSVLYYTLPDVQENAEIVVSTLRRQGSGTLPVYRGEEEYTLTAQNVFTNQVLSLLDPSVYGALPLRERSVFLTDQNGETYFLNEGDLLYEEGETLTPVGALVLSYSPETLQFTLSAFDEKGNPFGAGRLLLASEETSSQAETSAESNAESQDAEETTEEDEGSFFAGTLTYEGEGFSVRVEADEEAGLASDVSLSVSEYGRDSSAWEQRYAEAKEKFGWTEDFSEDVRLFSLSLLSGSEEVEPESDVEIRFSFDDMERYRVLHFPDDPDEEGAEEIEDAGETENGILTFSVSSFSDFMVLDENTFDESAVNDILDKNDSLTQGGASDSYYEDGHYYHIDIRVDSDFEYIYNEDVITIITGTDVIVQKMWQGGVPTGVTSVTFQVCLDNGDGTYSPLYYDEDGLLTTESTHTSSSSSGGGPSGGGGGPSGGGSSSTTVANDPVTITVSEADGWIGTIELEAGNYVLVEENVNGYESSVSYVTVDMSTGEQLEGSYYTSTGTIEVANVNWVVYEMNDNDNASYYYYDGGIFSGYQYGYLDGSLYSDPSDAQSQSTGDWEFFLDDGNSNGGRGLKFLTEDSTIYVNIDYIAYYKNEYGEITEYVNAETFAFTPDMWQDENLCTEKTNTNTMRGIDLLINGEYLAERITEQESHSEILASAANVNEEDDSIYLTGVKTWLDEEGNGELSHDNSSEIVLHLKRKTEGGEYEELTEGTDYVVSWSGSTYYIWGGYGGSSGSYVGLPAQDENGNEYFYLVEEDTIPGYQTTITERYEDEDGNRVEEGQGDFVGYDIVNQASSQVSGGFTLIKTNEEGEELSGAVFVLTNEDGTPVYFTEEDGVYTVSESSVASAGTRITAGSVSVEGLVPGNYTLTEVTAPDGYYFTESTVSVTVDEEGNVSFDGKESTSLTVENKKQGEPVPSKQADHTTDYNGDTIEYTVDVESIQGIHDLILHDYLDEELTLEESQGIYKVYVVLYPSEEDKENETNGTILVYGEDYTVSLTGTCTFDGETEDCTFEVDFSGCADLFDTLTSDAVLHIVYDCEADTEGDLYEGDATHLENIAHVTFTTHRSEDVEADVDLFGFELNKYTFDESGNPVSLVGVVFALTDEYGNTACFLKEEGGIYLFEGWVQAGEEAPEGTTTQITTTEDVLKIEGFAGDAGYTYTLTEISVPEGYQILSDPFTVVINEDGEVFFNGMEAEEGHVADVFNSPLTEISGAKTWDDAENQDGTRPDSITIRLYANSTLYREITVSSEEEWEWFFTDLPVYTVNPNSGAVSEVNYTVTEVSVSGYEQQWDEDHENVTNVHEPETVSVQAWKVWEDFDDLYETRPEEIVLNLLCDETETGQTLVLNEDGEWYGSIEDLPRYHDEGIEYAYSLTEVSVDGYETEPGSVFVNGTYYYTFTNTLETTSVSVEKKWEDDDDREGLRPSSLLILLLANEEEFDSCLLSDENEWSYTFTDLPTVLNGEEISWTVSEYEVPQEYVSSLDTSFDEETGTYSFVLTNTHEIETVSLNVKKEWEDEEDAYGNRPDSIDIELLDGDTILGTFSLSDANSWNYVFVDLPLYHSEDGNAVAYDYGIREVSVEGYDTETVMTEEDGMYVFTLTNTQQYTSVSGVKTWVGEDEAVRPESITVILTGNISSSSYPVIQRTITVTDETENAEGQWEYFFDELPVFVNGEKVSYTVHEVPIYKEGSEELLYSTIVDGNDITNVYPPKTSVTVNKVWNDNDNEKGLRPESIDIILYRNGDEYDSVSLSDANEWTYVFDDLDMYVMEDSVITDERYVYTVSEMEVPDGYLSSSSGVQEVLDPVTGAHEGYEITVINTELGLLPNAGGPRVWFGSAFGTILALIGTWQYRKRKGLA